VARINESTLGIGAACLFSDFARIYQRDVLSTHASTTQARSSSVLKNYLVPAFGELMLREMTLERLQAYFVKLQQSKLSHESVDKIRDVLSAVLRTAVDYSRLPANPAEKIRLRRRRMVRTKPFLWVDDFFRLSALIAEPYATMVYVAVFTGLRVSELAGLVWRNVHPDSITIDRRFSRGDWDEPKSHASRATIPVSASVIARIERVKSLAIVVRAGRATRRYQAVKASGPEDLVFQSVQKGEPLRDNNVLVRHIKPAARELGIGWVNWQVLRRSCATWLQQAGVDVKDAQGLLRHSRASTTQDIYQQLVPASQRRAVERLNALVETAHAVQ
jgi:integrase